MKLKYLYLTGIVIFLLSACGVKEDIAKLSKQVKYSTSDSDRDGVANIHDKDNSTDPEVKVYGDGTSVDTDMDGVADNLDYEIMSPKGAVVDSLGRAADSDGDGIPDVLDQDPKTPAGQMINFQGKSIAAGTSGGGAGVGGANMSQFPVVLFNYRTELNNLTYPAIVAVANYMKANPSAKMVVTGHTDEIGSNEDNLKLGEKRAGVVLEELALLGVDKSRLTVASKGEEAPTKLSYSKLNRRVEFSVAK